MSNVVIVAAKVARGTLEWFRLGNAVLLAAGSEPRHIIITLPSLQPTEHGVLQEVSRHFETWPQIQFTADDACAYVAVPVREIGWESFRRLRCLLEEILGEEIVEVWARPEVHDVLVSELLDLLHASVPTRHIGYENDEYRMTA